jgi:fructose-bisphosphate aldolase, class II
MKRTDNLFLNGGVITGEHVTRLFELARKNQFAYTAVNVIGSSSINASLAAAMQVNSTEIIQLSHGGSAFFLGKSLTLDAQQCSIQDAIAEANYVHQAAQCYGIQVMLHTDHAVRNS